MAKSLVFDRLNKLVVRGYTIRWRKSDQDSLRLEHPLAPDLTLFADGRIWVLTSAPDDWTAAENRSLQRRFQPFVPPDNWIPAGGEADHRRFKLFLTRIPNRTMLQRFLATSVEDVSPYVSVTVLVSVVGLLVALLIGLLWGLGDG